MGETDGTDLEHLQQRVERALSTMRSTLRELDTLRRGIEQARDDAREIESLIDNNDILGCYRLRKAILARGG